MQEKENNANMDIPAPDRIARFLQDDMIRYTKAPRRRKIETNWPGMARRPSLLKKRARVLVRERNYVRICGDLRRCALGNLVDAPLMV